jgi:hypothetical protein
MADTKQEVVSTQPQVCTCTVHLVSWRITLSYVTTHPCLSQSIVPMSAGGNKNALNRPIGPDGKRDWSYGLFDCFSECGLCTWSLTIANVFAYAIANHPFALPILIS